MEQAEQDPNFISTIAQIQREYSKASFFLDSFKISVNIISVETGKKVFNASYVEPDEDDRLINGAAITIIRGNQLLYLAAKGVLSGFAGKWQDTNEGLLSVITSEKKAIYVPDITKYNLPDLKIYTDAGINASYVAPICRIFEPDSLGSKDDRVRGHLLLTSYYTNFLSQNSLSVLELVSRCLAEIL